MNRSSRKPREVILWNPSKIAWPQNFLSSLMIWKKKQHDIEISAGYRQPTPPKKEAQRPKSNHQRHGRYTVGAHQIDSDFLDKIIESELSDPLAILKLIRNHSNIGFLYMTTAVDKSSINYNPYNVKCVVFSWFRYLCCFQDLFFIQNLRKIVNWC